MGYTVVRQRLTNKRIVMGLQSPGRSLWMPVSKMQILEWGGKEQYCLQISAPACSFSEWSAARNVLLLRQYKWCLAVTTRDLRRGRDWAKSEEKGKEIGWVRREK